MHPKYLLLFLLGVVLLAATAHADVEDRRLPPVITRPPHFKPPSTEDSSVETSETTTDSWKHGHHWPPKRHWPPSTKESSMETSETTTDSWKHGHHWPPKRHWPPITKDEPNSKVEKEASEKQAQEKPTTTEVEDGYNKPLHKKKPWKKHHPPSKN